MKSLFAFLPCLLALPASAQAAYVLQPGQYEHVLTTDGESVDTGSGTIVDAWSDKSVTSECLEGEGERLLAPGIAGDLRCAYRETGRAQGHVTFEMACAYPTLDMAGTGTLDFERARLDGFDQQITLTGYSGGAETTLRMHLSARRTGACWPELR
ncbi:MAG: DUF3617 family protein [Hyphomonas sp.]|nr:DUF3617 family protein [Hyphomonas sp.]